MSCAARYTTTTLFHTLCSPPLQHGAVPAVAVVRAHPMFCCLLVCRWLPAHTRRIISRHYMHTRFQDGPGQVLVSNSAQFVRNQSSVHCGLDRQVPRAMRTPHTPRRHTYSETAQASRAGIQQRGDCKRKGQRARTSWAACWARRGRVEGEWVGHASCRACTASPSVSIKLSAHIGSESQKEKSLIGHQWAARTQRGSDEAEYAVMPLMLTPTRGTSPKYSHWASDPAMQRVHTFEGRCAATS